jgi:hypothetical protein
MSHDEAATRTATASVGHYVRGHDAPTPCSKSEYVIDATATTQLRVLPFRQRLLRFGNDFNRYELADTHPDN